MAKLDLKLIKVKFNIGYLLTILLLVTLGCDDNRGSYNLNFEINPRLEKANDCYSLQLGQDWQTLHRISGTITESGVPIEGVKFYWESNLFWYMGDTTGYIIRRGLTDDLEYRNIDTFYIVGFNGAEVPTSNMASYSNADGVVNNMIAPVRSMIGDTMILRWMYEYGNYQSSWESIKICLD